MIHLKGTITKVKQYVGFLLNADLKLRSEISGIINFYHYMLVDFFTSIKQYEMEFQSETKPWNDVH